MKQNNLYINGMDSILSGSNYFSSPFIDFGNKCLPEIKAICDTDPDSIDYVKSLDLNEFLSSFFTCTNLFIETISQLFAEIIRRKTTREDVRSKTSDALTKEIRDESFNKIDEILNKYTSVMNELGIELANTDTLKSSVNGAINGGVLNFAATGKARGGAVAGALIGAVAAEMEKAALRKKLINSAAEGISEFTKVLPILSGKLMDQYSTYIFGPDIDFEKRDEEIKRGNEILNNISTNTLNILNQLLLYNDTTLSIEVNINNKNKLAKKSKKLHGFMGSIRMFIKSFTYIFKPSNWIKDPFGTLPKWLFRYLDALLSFIPGYESKYKDTEILEAEKGISQAMDEIKNNNFPKLKDSLSSIEKSIHTLTSYQNNFKDISKVFN